MRVLTMIPKSCSTTTRLKTATRKHWVGIEESLHINVDLFIESRPSIARPHCIHAGRGDVEAFLRRCDVRLLSDSEPKCIDTTICRQARLIIMAGKLTTHKE